MTAARAGTLRPSHLYKAVLLVFLLAVVFVHFEAVTRVLLLVYAAAILAVALNAATRWIPIERGWLAMIFALLGLSALIGLGFLLIPILMEQLRNFVERIPEYEEQLEQWGDWVRQQTGLEIALLSGETAQGLSDFFRGLDTEAIFGRARGLLEVLLFPFLILLGGLYALANPNERLLNPALRVVPPRHRDDTRRMFRMLGARLTGWIRGTLLAMVSVGILASVAFSVIGVPNPILLGTVAGLVEFIPIIGPWIGGVPAVLVALFDDPMKAVWVTLAVLGIQFLESNVITPWAMSQAAHVHPLVTLFALVLFGSIFGFLGILLAVPLVLLIWTVVEVFWVDAKLRTGNDAIEPVVKDKKNAK